jgi:diguanylate cyclase (GGDEF)-like protein
VTPAKVLIADDSLTIRAVVRADLENEGYQISEAHDGVTTVRQCEEDPPDVVLLDVEMPGLDGYQVLAKLKGTPGLKDIPIVFLTSRSDMDDVVAALRGGAHDYLKKPFQTPELLARVASALHVKRLQDELRLRNVELDRQSRTDPLTGLYNRRHLDEQLVRVHSDAVRHDERLSLLLLDVDHFKRINDTFGHPSGDEVLRTLATRLRGQLRAGDIAGRWGGEEFLIILPRTDHDEGCSLAERVRSVCSADPIVADGREITVTVSGGLVTGPGDSATAVVQLADDCLYEAKMSGRDKIASRVS